MFTFTVTPDEGKPYEVVATSRDIVLWEKLHKDNSLKKLESNLRMTDMYSLCAVAARRQGKFEGTVAEFADQADIQPESEEVDPTPTDR